MTMDASLLTGASVPTGEQGTGGGTGGGVTVVNPGTGITIGGTPTAPTVNNAGVLSFNGNTGNISANVVATLDSVNGTGAKLSSLASATLTDGCIAWVKSVGAYFQLQHSALTVDHITVETASGLSGGQWLRVQLINPIWTSRTGATAWFVDPSNVSGTASDENTGASNVLPLATWGEWCRRVYGAYYIVATTVTAMSDDPNASTTTYLANINGSATLTILGSTFSNTPVYSGTISAVATMAIGPAADEDTITDSGIPVSYTASGLMADGLICKRTSGTAAYFFLAKDNGAKTARHSLSVDVNTTTLETLAPGDTYSVYSLTKIPCIVMPPRGGRNNFTEVGYWGPSTGEPAFLNMGNPTRVWFMRSTTMVGNNNPLNCAMTNPSGQFAGDGGVGGLSSWVAGMMRGTGTQSIVCRFASFKAVTFQGCGPQANSGEFITFVGRSAVFDCTIDAVQSLYWSTILFFQPASLLFGTNSCVSGKGNTGAMLAAHQWSQIAYSGTSPVVPVVDASTSGSSIALGGTLTNVAALPINRMGTTGVGIYQSE